MKRINSKETKNSESEIKDGIFKLINDNTLSDEIFLIKLKDYLIKNLSTPDNPQLSQNDYQINNIKINQNEEINNHNNNIYKQLNYSKDNNKDLIKTNDIISKDKSQENIIKETLYLSKKRKINKNENGLKNNDNDISFQKKFENLIIYTKNNKKDKKIITPKKKIIISLNKNTYKFDVIEDITIKNLKKIIYCATGLDKTDRIKLFHNNKEYNSHPNLKLSFYFPNQESINFEVVIKQIEQNLLENKDEEEDEKEDNSDNETLKTVEKCKFHINKSIDYFCYDCNKSLCFQCFLSGLHKGHKYKNIKNELENSNNSIEKLFNGFTLKIQPFDEKFLMEIKEKLKTAFFPNLSQIIKEIEFKINQIFEENFNFTRDKFDKIKNIFDLIKIMKNKNLTIDDVLKYGLDSFDLKNQEISNKIKQYISDYEQFKEEIKTIGESVKIIYNELYEFLDKYLKNIIYEKIIGNLKNNENILEDKKKLFINLINRIKNTPRIINSKKIKKEIIENDT